jgi:hypothetical protein
MLRSSSQQLRPPDNPDAPISKCNADEGRHPADHVTGCAALDSGLRRNDDELALS